VDLEVGERIQYKYVILEEQVRRLDDPERSALRDSLQPSRDIRSVQRVNET
jgi:hypothetical protein